VPHGEFDSRRMGLSVKSWPVPKFRCIPGTDCMFLRCPRMGHNRREVEFRNAPCRASDCVRRTNGDAIKPEAESCGAFNSLMPRLNYRLVA
jgi:hypothetical protein